MNTTASLGELLRAALTGEALESVRARETLATVPVSRWRDDAPEVLEVFETYDLDPVRRGFVLQDILATLGATEFVVQLLRDPNRTELALRLVSLSGPNELLEQELASCPYGAADSRERAAHPVSGEGAIGALIDGIGRAYCSEEVEQDIRYGLSQVELLSPRQLGRLGPRLFQGMHNWEAVDGTRGLFFQVIGCLERADRASLLRSAAEWLDGAGEGRSDWVDWFVYVASCAPTSTWVAAVAREERPSMTLSAGWLAAHLGAGDDEGEPA